MVARSKSLKLLFSAETRSADAAEQLLITGLLMRIAETCCQLAMAEYVACQNNGAPTKTNIKFRRKTQDFKLKKLEMYS